MASIPGLSPPAPSLSLGLWGGADYPLETSRSHTETCQTRLPIRRAPDPYRQQDMDIKEVTRADKAWPPQTNALGWLAAGWPGCPGQGRGLRGRGSSWPGLSLPAMAEGPFRARWPAGQWSSRPRPTSHIKKSPVQRGLSKVQRDDSLDLNPGQWGACTPAYSMCQERESPSSTPRQGQALVQIQLLGRELGEGEIVQAKLSTLSVTDVARSACASSALTSSLPSWASLLCLQGRVNSTSYLVTFGQSWGRTGKPAPFPEIALVSPSSFLTLVEGRGAGSRPSTGHTELGSPAFRSNDKAHLGDGETEVKRFSFMLEGFADSWWLDEDWGGTGGGRSIDESQRPMGPHACHLPLITTAHQAWLGDLGSGLWD